jgi:E3 ubiquitin-protein ligase makorin
MNVEHTFAMKRSQGVQCSICLDVVLDKLNLSDRRFGILSECKHPFCLSCIRKWRNLSHANNKIVRACPICRVPSWFVTPSDVWIEEDEEKQRLIEGYKASLR